MGHDAFRDSQSQDDFLSRLYRESPFLYFSLFPRYHVPRLNRFPRKFNQMDDPSIGSLPIDRINL